MTTGIKILLRAEMICELLKQRTGHPGFLFTEVKFIIPNLSLSFVPTPFTFSLRHLLILGYSMNYFLQHLWFLTLLSFLSNRYEFIPDLFLPYSPFKFIFSIE